MEEAFSIIKSLENDALEQRASQLKRFSWQNNMQVGTFDKIGGMAIFISIGYTVFAAISWDWFPTPGDWGDIARIPKSAKNYIALLWPPITTLLYMIVRRRYYEVKS